MVCSHSIAIHTSWHPSCSIMDDSQPNCCYWNVEWCDIFANIVGANTSSNVFFSGLLNSTRFYSALISWLNLEMGFDVCFFEGMDTYWKTWLQLSFPTYVILLVAIIIIVSEYSIKFSRLIARRNPVATLSTLLLLSYTKFLQTTITTLSLVTLDYPDGSHKRVWLPDASVGYLSGKHIPLLIAAVFILLIALLSHLSSSFGNDFFTTR